VNAPVPVGDHRLGVPQPDRSPESTTVMPRPFLLGLLWLLTCLPVAAEVITNGLPIADVIKAMKKGGYTETGLDMTTRSGSGLSLLFWGVGEGVLIASYSTASQKISGMTFWLADDRPKATRHAFDLDVASFDT